MGQSAPTNSDQFLAFEARYRDFRRHLERADQWRFDEIVCEARRHTMAINRYPHLDFERPMMLAVLVGIMRQFEEQQAEIESLLGVIKDDLVDAGLMRRPFAVAGNQVQLAVGVSS